jgi:diguanylate cyclase (GGDEF)-like protein
VKLDLPTLLVVEAFIAAVSALVIVIACPRGRDARGSLWWVLGGVFTTMAIGLNLADNVRVTETVSIASSIAFIFSAACYWTGARAFGGRTAIYPLVPAGALVFAALTMIPPLAVPATVSMEISLGITAIYLLAGALELFHGKEKLWARWPLMALLLIHGLLFVAGTLESIIGELPPLELVPLSTWFGIIHFESIVFSMGVTAFVIAFVRERGEARHRTVAELDLVTGVATRRAFLDAAADALRRVRGGELPISVAVFDLDHFKSINDRFGHAMGDRVLKCFGDTVRGVLRRDDRVGRIGGEEFALLLPDTGLSAAFDIAERVRTAFEAAASSFDGVELHATVSVGVATARPDSTIQSLLVAADEGLYEAKARGRNRVERPPAKMGHDGQGFLNRVA